MNEKLIKLAKDIDEILEVLNNPIFDISKAQDIIKKHNLSNEKVAAYNSPLKPGYVLFENSTEEMLKNNLTVIHEILYIEYVEELKKTGM